MFAISDTLGAAIVAGVVAIVSGAVTSLFAYKAKKNSEESKASSARAEASSARAEASSEEGKNISIATGKAVNGEMEKFKKLMEEFYLAKGIKEGKDKAEADAAVKALSKAEGFEAGAASVTVVTASASKEAIPKSSVAGLHKAVEAVPAKTTGMVSGGG